MHAKVQGILSTDFNVSRMLLSNSKRPPSSQIQVFQMKSEHFRSFLSLLIPVLRQHLPRCATWKQKESSGKRKVKSYFQSPGCQRLSAHSVSGIYIPDFSQDDYNHLQTTILYPEGAANLRFSNKQFIDSKHMWTYCFSSDIYGHYILYNIYSMCLQLYIVYVYICIILIYRLTVQP